MREMDEPKPKKRSKAHRALAVARRKAYYASLPAFTLKNKKRTLARQLRRFPEDTQALKLYTERYGEDSAKSQLANAFLKSGRRAKLRKERAKRDWRSRRIELPMMMPPPPPPPPAYVPDRAEP